MLLSSVPRNPIDRLLLAGRWRCPLTHARETVVFPNAIALRVSGYEVVMLRGGGDNLKVVLFTVMLLLTS